MSNLRYRITLKPLAPFFFGAEETFGEGEASRYRAVSTRFPAQSALIGMLRRAMLIAAGHMTLHKKGEWVDSRRRQTDKDDPNYLKAVKLAGKGAFRYDQPSDLGIIRHLSPVMIFAENRWHIPAPIDAKISPKQEESVRLYRPGPNSIRPTILFDGYDPKAGLPDALLRDDGEAIAYDELYKKVSTVGIKKSRTGQTEEDAFFLKESYAFKKGAAFACLLETSEALPEKMMECRVDLGADRSPFLLTAKPFTGNDPIETFENQIDAKRLPRLVALSELIVDEEAAGLCEMIVGQRVRRRQIVRDKKKRYGIAKSAPFYRYEPGTVLYTSRPDELAEKLSKPHLQKAGINIFTTKHKQGDA